MNVGIRISPTGGTVSYCELWQRLPKARSWRKVQLVKCVLHIDEDLSLDPQHSHKDQAQHLYISTREAETSEFLQFTGGSVRQLSG